MATSDGPRGRRRAFTDEELRADLADGLKAAEIARKYSVSRQAVNKRINQIQQCTVAAAVAPEESRRFVRVRIDSMEELSRCLNRVNLLQDACDRWLRDADDPERYDVGPRSDDVMVTYEVTVEGPHGPRTEKRKKSMAALLAMIEEKNGDPIVCAETKRADPRELILATAAEVRKTVVAAGDLARMLADAKVMNEFRTIVLEEIQAASPEVAGAISERIRRRLVVHAAFRGPEALPG